MSAQNAGIVCWVLWSVISHFGVLAQRDAHTRDLCEAMSARLDAVSSEGVMGGADLLRQCLHMFPNKVIAARVV